jgi:quinol monooxygenase YgiN
MPKLVVHASGNVKAGREEELQDAFTKLVTESRKEAGVEAYIGTPNIRLARTILTDYNTDAYSIDLAVRSYEMDRF